MGALDGPSPPKAPAALSTPASSSTSQSWPLRMTRLPALLFLTFKQVPLFLWLRQQVMTELRMVISFPKAKLLISWSSKGQAGQKKHLKAIKALSPEAHAEITDEEEIAVYEAAGEN